MDPNVQNLLLPLMSGIMEELFCMCKDVQNSLALAPQTMTVTEKVMPNENFGHQKMKRKPKKEKKRTVCIAQNQNKNKNKNQKNKNQN